MPRVTVLMPVYNRPEYVDEAIRSVIEQDFSDFELLIVDDGSTDATPDVLRSWADRDERIVVVTSPANEGMSRARNRGLQQARGEYVATLDSDDLMLPGRLAAESQVLDEHPEVVIVSCAFEIVDRDGRHVATWRGGEPHEAVVHLLGYYNIVGGHGQTMFRRDDVLAIGGYWTEFPTAEDYDLFVRLLKRGRIVSVPVVGMKQRQHESQSNAQYAGAKRAAWQSIMGRALRDTLGRTASADEIDALIVVWRHRGDGDPALADRVMREGFARFCEEHRDRELQRIVRERIAKQWRECASLAKSWPSRIGFRLRALRW